MTRRASTACEGNVPLMMDLFEQSDLAIDLASAGSWKPGRLRAVAGPVARTLDLALLGVLYLGVVLLAGRPDLTRLAEAQVPLREVAVAALCLCAWHLILTVSGVYAPWRLRSPADYMLRAVIAVNAAAAVVGLARILEGRGAGVVGVVAVFWVWSVLGLGLERAALLALDTGIGPWLRRRRSLLIVGSGPLARVVHDELKGNPHTTYQVAGFVDSDPQQGFVAEQLVLGGFDRLEEILLRGGIDEVVIALPLRSHYEVVGSAAAVCRLLGVRVHTFTDQLGAGVARRKAAGTAAGAVSAAEAGNGEEGLRLKRMLDFSLACTALLLLAPLFFAVGLAVKLSSPGPMLFRQKRFGLNRRAFYMLKFRTMRVETTPAAAPAAGVHALPGTRTGQEPRLTPAGAFLRASSLDELPQLFNVLLGEMSLVGPRALPLREVDKVPETWRVRRFSVRPGMTCLWQIRGRARTEFDRRTALDLEYIERRSLWLDTTILLRTLPAVLLGRLAR